MLQSGVSRSRWSDNIAALVIIPPAFVVMVVMDLSGRLSLSSTKL